MLSVSNTNSQFKGADSLFPTHNCTVWVNRCESAYSGVCVKIVPISLTPCQYGEQKSYLHEDVQLVNYQFSTCFLCNDHDAIQMNQDA